MYISYPNRILFMSWFNKLKYEKYVMIPNKEGLIILEIVDMIGSTGILNVFQRNLSWPTKVTVTKVNQGYGN